MPKNELPRRKQRGINKGSTDSIVASDGVLDPMLRNNKNVRILVVDDSKVALNTVCKMLTSLGYEAIAADDGAEALRIMESENSFKLVLTDINMPQMDGWELASCIKILKPDITIIALTGEDPNSILPRLHGSGISHALFKPFKIDLLNDAMESIFRTEKLWPDG